jgi:hypothetical protein
MDGVVALPGDWQGGITPVRIREWTGLAFAHPEFPAVSHQTNLQTETLNIQPKHDNQNHLRAAPENHHHPHDALDNQPPAAVCFRTQIPDKEEGRPAPKASASSKSRWA